MRTWRSLLYTESRRELRLDPASEARALTSLDDAADVLLVEAEIKLDGHLCLASLASGGTEAGRWPVSGSGSDIKTAFMEP